MAWTGRASPAVEIDGKDISSLLKTRGARSPHDELVLFNNEKVAAIRTQDWKLVVRSYYRTLDLPIEQYGYAHLVDVKADPGEAYNVAALHPDVMKDMMARVDRAKKTFEPLGLKQVPDRLPNKGQARSD